MDTLLGIPLIAATLNFLFVSPNGAQACSWLSGLWPGVSMKRANICQIWHSSLSTSVYTQKTGLQRLCYGSEAVQGGAVLFCTTVECQRRVRICTW